MSSSRAQQGQTQDQPLGFGLLVTGLALVALIGGSLFVLLQNMGLPLEKELSKIVRTLVNPLLNIAPDSWKPYIFRTLGDPSRQAALGYWLASALTAPLLLGYWGRRIKLLNKRFTLEDLIRIHAQRMPRVKPVVNCDPREDKDPDGPWAPAWTQWEWVEKHKIPIEQMFDMDAPPKTLRTALMGPIAPEKSRWPSTHHTLRTGSDADLPAADHQRPEGRQRDARPAGGNVRTLLYEGLPQATARGAVALVMSSSRSVGARSLPTAPWAGFSPKRCSGTISHPPR